LLLIIALCHAVMLIISPFRHFAPLFSDDLRLPLF